MTHGDKAPYRIGNAFAGAVHISPRRPALRKVMLVSKRIGFIATLTLATGIGVVLWNMQVPANAQTAPVTAMQFTGEAPPPEGTMTLWYREPASDHPYALPGRGPAATAATAEWVKALPVGNGRLGAMVFGGVVNERLQLNEDTLYAGGPYDPVNPAAHDALPEVR